jgi:hypothetical protein
VFGKEILVKQPISLICFLVCAALASAADAPSIAKVWIKPDVPIRGTALEFAILGDGFNADSVTVTLFGPSCENGCMLTLNGPKNSRFLTGSKELAAAGDYQITVKNGDGPATPKTAFCRVMTPRITGVWTKPSPPVAGTPFELDLTGIGFEAATRVALLNTVTCTRPNGCPVAIRSNASGLISGVVTAPLAADYQVALWNAGDAQFAEADLRVPPPEIKWNSWGSVSPSRGTPFDFIIEGSNFIAGGNQIRVFDMQRCRPPAGCAPTVNFAHASSNLLVGKMTIGIPGSFSVGVVVAGVQSSNFVPLVVR